MPWLLLRVYQAASLRCASAAWRLTPQMGWTFSQVSVKTVSSPSFGGAEPLPQKALSLSIQLTGPGPDVDEFKAALAGEEAVTKFCNAQRPGMLSADPASIVEQLSSLLPEVDRKAILENPNVGQELVGSMAEALRSGVDGWVDDDLAFAKPWGFELSEIRVPVLLYQGDQDMMVPLAHGKWLSEHLPQDKVRSHLMNGEGHFSIAHRHFDAMLAEILVAARR